MNLVAGQSPPTPPSASPATPEFWVDLQARSDLDVAKKPAQARIDEEVPPRPHGRPLGREDLRPLLDQEAEGS